ncbi:MAG: CoA-binding protein [Bacteroidales bacterium]|nr:CoA-binding protein [Bacteroidales bacterium]
MDKIIVLGASPNPLRFSYKAVKSLGRRSFDVVAVGYKEDSIGDVKIIKGKPQVKDVHTVLLYLGPKRQVEYYNYIVELHPKRVIFNPGTENEELKKMLVINNIEAVYDCALVMLNTNSF